MVNGYVNVPKEFFDIPAIDMMNVVRLEPGDELFNKFFEFVMAARHKVPVFAGTLNVKENEESTVDVLSINVAGIYLSTNSQEGGTVKCDIAGYTFVIDVLPSEISIKIE